MDEVVSLREQLADLAHQQWSGWMEYLFSQCKVNADGTATIPAWAVSGWCRQMKSAYADLSEDEQESDRKEADRVLAVCAVAFEEFAHTIQLCEDEVEGD